MKRIITCYLFVPIVVMGRNKSKHSVRQIKENSQRIHKLLAVIKEFRQQINSELSEQNRELWSVKEKLQDLEIGADIHSQLVLANDDRINYLEKELANYQLCLIILGSFLGLSMIIKFFVWLFTKPLIAKVGRNKKGQFVKLKK